MMTEVQHPDHLQPGHMVGPWRIVDRLGVGGFGRVFKVEREGLFFTMKMALRPSSTDKDEEEEETSWRMRREVAALLTYSPLPNLLRVHAVDCWPHPRKGYLFFVTDFVEADTWHGWRWRTPPHAGELLDAFSEVVRTVGVLHSRGVYHRDLKAENVLIRREDGRPVLIDFGNVRLPGAFTRTQDLPPGVIHLMPPEVLAYTRSEVWKEGVPFRGGVAADLYALGVLLYQGLTDLHPFNPELPDTLLLAIIATVPPKAPHLLNPRAPRSLGDIALKLLEKRPEDRYPDAEALLRALEDAGKERTSSSWTVPLFAAEGVPAEPSSEEVAQPARLSEMTDEASEEAPPPEEEEPQPEGQREAPAIPASRPRHARRLLVLLACLTVLGLALWLARSTLAGPPEALLPGSGRSEKGSPPVSTTSPSAPSRFLAAWLCSVAGLGCPAAQVRPPKAEDCPKDATAAMRQLKIGPGDDLRAVVDIKQPGDQSEAGVYQDGPVIGRLTRGAGELPVGTLLQGRLWTGPGIYEVDSTGFKYDSALGRYTVAVLPDGRKYPVCIVLGDAPYGLVPKAAGSMPGAALLARELPISPVWRWPEIYKYEPQ